jgi:hypothetical protein
MPLFSWFGQSKVIEKIEDCPIPTYSYILFAINSFLYLRMSLSPKGIPFTGHSSQVQLPDAPVPFVSVLSKNQGL